MRAVTSPSRTVGGGDRSNQATRLQATEQDVGVAQGHPAATTLVLGRFGAPGPEPHKGSRSSRLVWNELTGLLGPRAIQARPPCVTCVQHATFSLCWCHRLWLVLPADGVRGDQEQRAKVRGAVSQPTSSLTPGGAGGAHDTLSPRLLCQPVTSPELQAPARPTQATSPNQYFRLGPHSHAQESRCQVRPPAVTTALLSQSCCARWVHLVLLTSGPENSSPLLADLP